MPVILLSPREYVDPLTNEVLTGKIPVNSVAYEITAKNTIYVLRPVVDTITATFNVNVAWSHYQAHVSKPPGAPPTLESYLERVFNQAHVIHDQNKWPTKFKRVKRYGNGYRYNFALHKTGQDSLPVMNFKAAPPATGTTFRMEFSADALRYGVPQLMRERWATLDGGVLPFPALMASAKVTRIDLAIDIINLPLSDIIPHHPKAQTVWTAQTFLSAIETVLVYTGAKKKSHQSYKKRANLKLYDKQNEQRSKKKKPIYGDLPHTRIEFGHVQGPLFRNLHRWTPKDPPKWRFFRHPHTDGENSSHLARILDSIRVRGLPHLAKMNPDTPVGLEALEQYFPDDLIRPELYSQFHRALKVGGIGKLVEWAALSMDKSFSLPKEQ